MPEAQSEPIVQLAPLAEPGKPPGATQTPRKQLPEAHCASTEHVSPFVSEPLTPGETHTLFLQTPLAQPAVLEQVEPSARLRFLATVLALGTELALGARDEPALLGFGALEDLGRLLLVAVAFTQRSGASSIESQFPLSQSDPS